MPLQITSAPSSRITSATSKNPLRSSASPLKGRRRAPQSSPLKRKASALDDDEGDAYGDDLQDRGLVTALATDLRLRDVPQQMQYAADRMFDPLPEAGGFNSVRIAEILNFRKHLPPIVTVGHVHALSRSQTLTDREIAELVRKGVLRRISIPSRGLGRTAIGDSLVLTERWVAYVEGLQLEPRLRGVYIKALHEHPGSLTVPMSYFGQADTTALIHAGLLTAASSGQQYSQGFAAAPPSGLATAGSRAAAGSLEAVGGASAFLDAGGGGARTRDTSQYGPALSFTLPAVGAYLKLLDAARSHLAALLAKSRARQAPEDFLRECWDGAVAPADAAGSVGSVSSAGSASSATSRRRRSASALVLPAKTRKWRQLWGLRFDWILEQSMGTGLVEVFETGAVGRGVRLTR